MALFKWSENWDPFVGLRSMQKELERIFGGVGTGRGVGGGVYPPVNVYNGEAEIVVECEVPGMKKEDIDLSLTAETLVVKGTKAPSAEEDAVKYQRRERGAGDFSRTIVLPDKVDADGITAALERGILTIRLPKSEAAKPKQITVS